MERDVFLESIRIPHMPEELHLFAALFSDVQNPVFLREQLLAGNTAFEYAFIDASMLLSRTHALAAVFRAMNDHLHDRLKSKNIHSEIVFALSPNNNIGEAFRRFGIGDKTSNVLVLKVATDPSISFVSVHDHLKANIDGQSLSFNDESLERISDLDRIRKAYKMTVPSTPRTTKRLVNGDTTSNVTADVSNQNLNKVLESQILGAMALRGAA